jgi:hypothetical protein
MTRTDPFPAAGRLARAALLGGILALLLSFPAAAQAPEHAPEPPRSTSPGGATLEGSRELRDADAARFAAMVTGDLVTLERMLGPDLSYTHSNGLVQDRAEFLAALRKGSLRYESMAPSDVAVRLYGPAGVVTGRIDMKVALDGKENRIAARYTAVYVRRDGRWQLVAWHSSPIAAPAGPPPR